MDGDFAIEQKQEVHNFWKIWGESYIYPFDFCYEWVDFYPIVTTLKD